MTLDDDLAPAPAPESSHFDEPDHEETPPDEAEAAARLAAEWNSSLRPINAFEVRLVDAMAMQAVRIDRCQQDQRDLRTLRAAQAARHWDRDRAEEAEALGATLAKSPALVARKLRRTSQGCTWLLARWNLLIHALASAGAWDEPQTRLAHDLLGVPPEFRAAGSSLPSDREGRLARIAAEVEAIVRDQADLADAERLERALAERGGGPDPDGRLALLHRQEQAYSRRFEWAKEQLKKGRHAHQPAPTGGHRPPAPAPPFPPPRVEKTEEEWRQVTRARAALKAAALTPPPIPAQTPALARVSEGHAHPGGPPIPLLGPIPPRLPGEAPVARPPNRQARRAHQARARRA